jgi:uncharacterized protein YkwD
VTKRLIWLGLALLLVTGCSSRGGLPAPEHEDGASRLGLSEAREVVIALVNRDRVQAGLGLVRRDEAAERAAQLHAESMAAHGFTAHYGLDGSAPEERYNRAGGEHVMFENVACFFDATQRPLDPAPVFGVVELHELHAAFMGEAAPNDGHRQNALSPQHTGLGVGLARPLGAGKPCIVQGFVDAYGSYDPLPARARIGQAVRVAGRVSPPAIFAAVGLSRREAAGRLTADRLNETTTYRLPDPYALFYPKGYESPKPVRVEGDRFEVTVELSESGRLGRYQVSIWARFPETGDAAVPISVRTIVVE